LNTDHLLAEAISQIPGVTRCVVLATPGSSRRKVLVGVSALQRGIDEHLHRAVEYAMAVSGAYVDVEIQVALDPPEDR
jgi:hypothetical protein